MPHPISHGPDLIDILAVVVHSIACVACLGRPRARIFENFRRRMSLVAPSGALRVRSPNHLDCSAADCGAAD